VAVTSPEKYILVKAMRAGLGDLMLGVLQGLLFARLRGRTLVVDWTNSVYAPADANLSRSCLSSSPSLAPTPWIPPQQPDLRFGPATCIGR